MEKELESAENSRNLYRAASALQIDAMDPIFGASYEQKTKIGVVRW